MLLRCHRGAVAADAATIGASAITPATAIISFRFFMTWVLRSDFWLMPCSVVETHFRHSCFVAALPNILHSSAQLLSARGSCDSRNEKQNVGNVRADTDLGLTRVVYGAVPHVTSDSLVCRVFL